MKKTFALFILLLFSLLEIFSKEYVTTTEHFDFIWSDETKVSAEEVISSAEDYYSDLVSFFGVDPELHIPVYFKSDTKTYNAYYTAYAENHIVLFVTAFSPSLFPNADKPLSLTFFHELTHAFTASIKSPFISFLSSIFGDAVILGNLYLNKGFVEGIAVYMESTKGEGRLNNPASLYLVNQIVAEGLKFKYLDISGARDITPGGTMSYILGASFLCYLSSSYGSYRLSSFIVECYKFPLSTTELIFKEIFGVKLSEAWLNFLSSWTIEETLSSPEYITPSGSWRNLTLHNNTLYGEDLSSSGLYEITEEGEKRVKLTSSSFESLSFSPSYYILPHVTTDSRSVAVYKINGGKYREWEDYYTGLLMGDEKVLLATEYDGENTLDLYSIESEDLIYSFNLGRDISLSSTVALSDDEALFLISQNGRRHLLDISLSEGSMTLIDLDTSIEVNSLSLNSDGTIAFSYITDDKSSFMKYGELKYEEGGWSYILSSNAYSGGIYYPVKKGGDVYFVSRLFSESRVSRISYSSLNFSERAECTLSSFVPRTADESEVGIEVKDYNALFYMNKGLLLPVGSAKTKTAGDITGLGLYYTTIDPTEKHTLSFSLGFDVEEKKPFAFTSYSYKDYFNVSFSTFYKNGRTSFELDTTLSYKKTLSSDNRYFLLSDTLAFSYLDLRGRIINYFSFGYQDVYRLGKGRHENLGWGGKITLVNTSPSLDLVMLLPRLIPINSSSRATFSLPFTLTFSLSNFRRPIIGIQGDIYLFTYEVQSSIRFMRLYVRNIDVVFTYKGIIATGERNLYRDTYSLKADFSLSPLVGMLSTLGFKLSLGVTYDREKTKFSLLFNLGT